MKMIFVLVNCLRKFSLSDESLPPKWLKCSIVFRMSPIWKEALHHTFQALRNNEWEHFWGGDNWQDQLTIDLFPLKCVLKAFTPFRCKHLLTLKCKQWLLNCHDHSVKHIWGIFLKAASQNVLVTYSSCIHSFSGYWCQEPCGCHHCGGTLVSILSPWGADYNSSLYIFLFRADGFTVQADLGRLPEQCWE